MNNYIDFEIVNVSENEDIIANALVLSLERDGDYLKDLKVYGSYDNEEWHYIRSDKIYKTTDGKKDKVLLKKDYKFNFYRILFLNEPRDVKIRSLKALNIQELVTNINDEKVKKVEYEVTNSDQISTIRITNKDLLKINEIEINSDDKYDRSYTIFAEDVQEKKKMFFGSGRIYNINLENFQVKNNTIELEPYTKYPSIIINVYNKDNLPIQIESINAHYIVDKVIFEAKEDESYRMIFGNKLSANPTYDIENYKEYVAIEDKNLVQLGELKDNELFTKALETRVDLKLILNLLILLISALLIIVIYKNYKKNM